MSRSRRYATPAVRRGCLAGCLPLLLSALAFAVAVVLAVTSSFLSQLPN